MIRHLILGSALTLGASAALSHQGGNSVTSAEGRARAALSKIEELNRG